MSSKHPKNMSENCTWFCSIDIGTSYSGYAFAPRKNLTTKSCFIYGIWEYETSSHKIPTTLLFDQNEKFVAFGHAADKKYTKLCEKKENDKWFYFRDFKMELYNCDVSKDLLIRDIHEKSFKAQQIFVESIRFLRKHFLDKFESRNYDILEDDVCFILTVPAIWSDAAKQFMKEAAIEAEISETRLMMAYEPEAAAVFCKRLTGDLMAANDNPVHFAIEQSYIVVDSGGGTVDITVQKISSTGILHNLYKASGGEWGGNKINKAFMKLLDQLFGSYTIQKLCEVNMEDFFDLIRKIETAKREVTTDETETVKIDIPLSLLEIHSEICKLTGLDCLNKAIEDAELQDKIEAKLGKIFIKNAYFLECFQTICKKTVDLIKPIIQNEQQGNKKITIILVGGFSESEVVQSIYKSSFPKHNIKIPFEAGLAVLKGAVIYGFDSRIIDTRICPYTYGIKLERRFNPSIDNPSKTFMKGDQLYTDDSFDKFFEIDEPLAVGTKRSIEVHFNHDDENLSCDLTDYKEIEVFSSSGKSPLYTTDPTCRLHGMIRVYPPHGRWPIKVKGRVEIEVIGVENFRITYIDDTDSSSASGTIDFLSTYTAVDK